MRDTVNAFVAFSSALFRDTRRQMLKSLLATAAVATLLAAASPSAHALVISHDGSGTGGIIAAAGGQVPVGLLDEAAASPGSDLNVECEIIPVDACLVKRWSGGETHTMTVVPDQASTVIGELVYNLTSTPWSAYQVEIVGGADLLGIGYSLFVLNGDEILDITDVGISHQIVGNVFTLIFDQPFISFDGGPNSIALGILFAGIGDGTFVVEQSPILTVDEPGMMALFGFAIAGAGIARRRRR